MLVRTYSEEWLDKLQAALPAGDQFVAAVDGWLYGLVAPKDPVSLVVGRSYLAVVPSPKRATSLAVGFKNWEKLFRLRPERGQIVPLHLVQGIESAGSHFLGRDGTRLTVAVHPRTTVKFFSLFSDEARGFAGAVGIAISNPVQAAGNTGYRLMSEFQPLEDPTEEDLLEGFGQGLAGRPTPLAERNAWANAVLAWAEQQGQGQFDHLRHLVFQREFAVNARDWVERFPEVTTELAVLKQMALMSEMAKAHGGEGCEGFEKSFGPDIPKIVNDVYAALVEAKTKS